MVSRFSQKLQEKSAVRSQESRKASAKKRKLPQRIRFRPRESKQGKLEKVCSRSSRKHGKASSPSREITKKKSSLFRTHEMLPLRLRAKAVAKTKESLCLSREIEGKRKLSRTH